MVRSPQTGEGARRGVFGRVMKRLDDASRGPFALTFLFLGSVLESTVLPWPIEFPMVAYMLRGKRQTVEVVAVAVAGSVVGSLLFYLAGRTAFELLEGFIAARPGLESSLQTAQDWIAEWGVLAVAFTTMAPIPIQMASLAAGLSQMAILPFVLAIAAGRSIRYWAMGLVVIVFGDRIIAWWKAQPRRRRRWAMAILTGVFTGLFLWGAYSLFTPG